MHYTDLFSYYIDPNLYFIYPWYGSDRKKLRTEESSRDRNSRIYYICFGIIPVNVSGRSYFYETSGCIWNYGCIQRKHMVTGKLEFVWNYIYAPLYINAVVQECGRIYCYSDDSGLCGL